MMILVADDSETIVGVLRFLLESHGYDVISASDGIEAISKTYKSQPDLVLLDIEMPKMTGYQVCRLLKSDTATKNIPIIILTSRGHKRDRFWGLSTGADDFITKNFESETELFKKIEAVIRQATSSKDPIPEHERHNASERQSQSIQAPITEVSVLEQVNHILDRQLFQATIVNELSYLAINMHSFFTTIHSLFNLLAKVCEFEVASIFLKEEKLYNIFLYMVPPVSRQFLQSVKQQVIDVYKNYQPLESIEHVEVTILKDTDQENCERSASREKDVATFFTLPLKVRNSIIGVLALGSAKENAFNAETLETLRVFTNEASIVLDNSVLFKQLEQSNLELEETIDKLKRTQAQLVQSEKMASLGQLVAGVAHEINTPSGAINAATSNLMNVLSDIVESFRLMVQEGLTHDDQQILLAIITRFTLSITTARRSTISIREESKALEIRLENEHFPNARRAAKQIARFSLTPEHIEALLSVLSTYDAIPILDFLEKCHKIIHASRDIKTSIHMITKIVNALKLYSRVGQATVEETDIHEGIETTLTILQNHLKYGIEVIRDFGELPKIPCYVNELNQVWTNIIHNAIQAMDGSGTLTITTSVSSLPTLNVSPDTEDGEFIGDNMLDGRVIVCITDTGPGIPLSIQGKIFDPYFTTKDQGEGSGLGLGITQQIVERHHGEIRVKSQPGNTTFEVFLPISGVQKEFLAS
ncbi:hypothetical protein CSA56_05020 [candidate division KSB3 bacterium]|uniref:histidine kinase n=1 Tax=candidate division KSB3 bacterium TaxID=2044937 RepID=A0A2G6KIQ2_9BACT|nr:MAG: hypothetical protein CSA56_05020 [candidate division KSB3 bacterium]